jgi:predicted SPOUT superfamily RNA methylase MTH1
MSKRRLNKVTIAIPASIVSEFSNLRDKTEVIGKIARSAAIFRVEEIIIYPDEPDESNLIKLILGYIETPQYLRKHLYSFKPELQYAGVLPPLRTPHHPIESQLQQLRVGEFREGVINKESEGNLYADIGVNVPLKLTGRIPSIGSRVTIQVTKISPTLEGILSKKSENKTYWGYTIQASKKSIDEILISKYYDLTIGTSRLGNPYNEKSDEFKNKWSTSKNTLIVFGSPRQGLHEIIKIENQKNAFDFYLNTIPEQGCATIRTDEAMLSTLAIFNTL